MVVQASVWRAKEKLVICGDLKQLPPVVTAKCHRRELENTLMERALLNPGIEKVQLQIQHRYPKVIGDFVSEVGPRWL